MFKLDYSPKVILQQQNQNKLDCHTIEKTGGKGEGDTKGEERTNS